MSSRKPRRWWHTLSVQVLAGDTADTDALHVYVTAQDLSGNTVFLLPTDEDGTGIDITLVMPSVADYYTNRTELWTAPMDFCDLDYIQIVLRNNSLTDTYFVGHIRGSSWG